jgi:exopolysaccharide biosynthesis protein
MKRLFTAIAILFIGLNAFSQNRDSITFVNTNWTTTKYPKHIVSKTYHFDQQNFFGRNQYISIVEIGKKSKLKFALAYQPKELIKLDSIAQINKAIAGINGTFFDIKNGGSVDYLRVNNQLINPSRINKSGFRAEHQKGAIVTKDKKIKIQQWNGDEHWEDNLLAKDVMISGPVLRVDNQDALLAHDVFNYALAPRSMIGIKADGAVLLVAIDGRLPEAKGVSIFEEQQLMKWLGCVDALNLDGGGSTTLYLKNGKENEILNHPSDNKTFDHLGLRKIANAILLVK